MASPSPYSSRPLWGRHRRRWPWNLCGLGSHGHGAEREFKAGVTASPNYEDGGFVNKQPMWNDLVMIEVGAYHKTWPDWHIGPEQALEAHKAMRGKLFLPIHWGLFDLALHGWTEPAERTLAAAQKADRGRTSHHLNERWQSRKPLQVGTLDFRAY